MKYKKSKYVFLAAVFIMMCAVKLWFTLYIIFEIALILTLFKGNRIYCNKYCPMGTLQDLSVDSSTKNANNKKYNKGFTFAFWSILVFISVYFWHEKWLLWQRTLLLMGSSALVAMYYQSKKGKRYWCTNLCPLGHVMDLYVTKINKNPS